MSKVNKKFPYIIFEIANTHSGEIELVMEMIKEFSNLDYPKKGIKFQVFYPDTIALPDYEWYSVYKKLYFSKKTWKLIIQKARDYGDVWLDLFDLYSTEVLSENLKFITGVKIQASILENYEVYNELLKLDISKKKIILNISGYEVDRIKNLINNFALLTKNIIIQIGFQGYPTDIEDTSLNKISVLKENFPEYEISIADHADAESRFAKQVPIYSALLGCSYLEKHFCLSRKETKYDKFSALNIDEFKTLSEDIKQLVSANSGSFIKNTEKKYLQQSIQIPILNKDLSDKDLVGYEDLFFRRTSQQGIQTEEIFGIQGRHNVLDKNKPKYSPIFLEDFRKAKIGVIVACRMKSKRLPQKAIIPILGVSSVERCLVQCLEIKGIDKIILATSNLDEDSVLEDNTCDSRVIFFQGDPDNVIKRYVDACKKFEIDIVVRITADCPLIIPEIIEQLVDEHFKSGADFTYANSFAVGTSGEIINFNALKKISEIFEKAEYSEYMSWYFKNNPENFKINAVDLPKEFIRDYRMTLDYPEDLLMFEQLYQLLGGEKKAHMGKEIFEALDSNPSISKINQNKTLKYLSDKKLIHLLDQKTKITRT